MFFFRKRQKPKKPSAKREREDFWERLSIPQRFCFSSLNQPSFVKQKLLRVLGCSKKFRFHGKPPKMTDIKITLSLSFPYFFRRPTFSQAKEGNGGKLFVRRKDYFSRQIKMCGAHKLLFSWIKLTSTHKLQLILKKYRCYTAPGKDVMTCTYFMCIFLCSVLESWSWRTIMWKGMWLRLHFPGKRKRSFKIWEKCFFFK